MLQSFKDCLLFVIYRQNKLLVGWMCLHWVTVFVISDWQAPVWCRGSKVKWFSILWKNFLLAHTTTPTSPLQSFSPNWMALFNISNTFARKYAFCKKIKYFRDKKKCVFSVVSSCVSPSCVGCRIDKIFFSGDIIPWSPGHCHCQCQNYFCLGLVNIVLTIPVWLHHTLHHLHHPLNRFNKRCFKV